MGEMSWAMKVNEAMIPGFAAAGVLVDDCGGYRAHGDSRLKPAFVV
jgi:hypothetical protein